MIKNREDIKREKLKMCKVVKMCKKDNVVKRKRDAYLTR